MTDPRRPVNLHKAYHAHVYFDQESVDLARRLCTEASDLFGLKTGRLHQTPVGPHPMWSCQIAFGKKHFDTLIPWLDKNRQGLTVLIHGLTGDDLKDHTDYAYWLGPGKSLKLEAFGADEVAE